MPQVDHSWSRLNICLGCKKGYQYKPAENCPKQEHFISYEKTLGRNRLRLKKYYVSRYREKALNRLHDYYVELRDNIFKLLGNKCTECGYSDFRALHVHHVNNNGHEERKHVLGREYYSQILEKIKNGSKEYVILCANCNFIHKYENLKHRRPINLPFN